MGRGRLYVVATPIGNLEDITARALRILNNAGLVAAEDTRHSRRLLDHFGIKTPLTSYHDHNESLKTGTLLGELRAGKDVALISDAGTPCISDPGFQIVREALAEGIDVISIPGPSSVVAALAVSGLPSGRFTFHGFFPRKPGHIQSTLDLIASFPSTHIFFESPHRLNDSLAAIAARFPDAAGCVARELTKLHEEVATGTMAHVARAFADAPVRGECVILIHTEAMPISEFAPSTSEIASMVEERMQARGMSRRDAIKSVAEELRLPRNLVYDAATESRT